MGTGGVEVKLHMTELGGRDEVLRTKKVWRIMGGGGGVLAAVNTIVSYIKIKHATIIYFCSL